MTAYNVVRIKVKPGKDQEMMDHLAARLPGRPARRRAR